jgi:putative oxidoreductase
MGADVMDVASVILRVALGATMIAHGWNHAFGGGGLAGTARWFESIGVRPGRVHALLATLTELGAGILLLLGLATPLAAAAVVATMLVAFVANHRKNGFFIFRPGEGYEYVLMIALATCALGALGGGKWSLDHALGLHLTTATAVAISAGGGVVGSALLLATCWRPNSSRKILSPTPAFTWPLSLKGRHGTRRP